MSDIFCREAVAGDLPEILRLYAQPDLDDGRVLALEDAQRLFERMRAYPDYHVYVALDGRAIVGTFALLIMDNLGHMGTPSAIVEDVAVDPQRHGRGIGRTMMQHAMALSAAGGCYKLTLSSNLKREKAHAFYEAMGFERHGYSFRWPSSEPGR
jgi:GNAT superfamily N-acetyltransferase